MNWLSGKQNRNMRRLIGAVILVSLFFSQLFTATKIARADLQSTSVLLPSPDGEVDTIATGPDGTIYFGGTFGTVAGQSRMRLAALSSSGNLSSWNPGANDLVLTAVVVGSTVYIGGDFTQVGGQSRNHLAAIDSTGSVTNWNPGATGSSGSVLALTSSASTVYAAGDFTSLSGQGRSHIGAVDLAGNATAWNPGSDNIVGSLALAGNTLYAGGTFTTIGGASRTNIAALDITSGTATSWNPGSNGAVVALAVSGSSVYASGAFSALGGQNRNLVGAIDASTGNTISWNPQVATGSTAFVGALAFLNTTLFIGGSFASVAGQSQSNFAAFNDSANPGFIPQPPPPPTNPNPPAPPPGLTLPFTPPDMNTPSTSPASATLSLRYPTGTLINDNHTVLYIFQDKKIAFTNFPAFTGLGYSLRNVITAHVPQYTPVYGFTLWTADMAHPFGSWVNYNGTLYYMHETGMIGVPSWKTFLNNHGKQKYIVQANRFDIDLLNGSPNLPLLTSHDSRVY